MDTRAFAYPVLLGEVNPESMVPGSSHWLPVGRVENSTAGKLIMLLAEAGDALVDALEELDAYLGLTCAKLYFGREGDLLLVLYYPEGFQLVEDDILQIRSAIPEIRPFLPTLCPKGSTPGLIWEGQPHADSEAHCVFR